MALSLRGAVEQLRRGETVLARGLGHSMTPLIVSGEIVTLIPVELDSELHKGDIVLAQVNGRLYLHLIRALAQDEVLIANNHGRVNGWTARTNVYGLRVPNRPIPRRSVDAR
jgi:hypothetical protein